MDRPQRQTPVLLLDIPEWKEEEAIRSNLIQTGVAPLELVHKENHVIPSGLILGPNGTRVDRLDLSYPAALTLAGVGPLPDQATGEEESRLLSVPRAGSPSR